MSTTYEAFDKLKTILNQAKSRNYNLMLVSIPGTGLSHYLKQYQQENSVDMIYITDLNTATLSSFNIIDISFLTNPSIFEDIDKLWLSAKVDQKFAIVIDDPGWLRSEQSKKCQFLDRIYSTSFFPVHQESDIRQIAQEKNPEITFQQLTEVITNSAGLARLIKYISLKESFAPLWWLEDKQLHRLIHPTLISISHCNDEELSELGIKNSQLITDLLQKVLPHNFDIKITPALSILENDQDFHKKVSAIEKTLLEEMKKNEGMISKEKIAEIKWGENSYDSFSDQAIKKTMIRLSVKLRKYRIKSITKFGYQLSLR